MSGCISGHEHIYHGSLNIYRSQELIKVVDVWKCRRCGDMRVGTRGPEVLSSTEGMLPELPQDRHWILLVCKSGAEPSYEILQASDSEYIPHTCSGTGGEQLYYVRGKGVFYSLGGPPAGMHYVYELAKTVRGYIELGKTPPEIVTLLR